MCRREPRTEPGSPAALEGRGCACPRPPALSRGVPWPWCFLAHSAPKAPHSRTRPGCATGRSSTHSRRAMPLSAQEEGHRPPGCPGGRQLSPNPPSTIQAESRAPRPRGAARRRRPARERWTPRTRVLGGPQAAAGSPSPRLRVKAGKGPTHSPGVRGSNYATL